jgi:hypothetical protein
MNKRILVVEDQEALEVGAVCGKPARTDLRGGRLATAVPTANLGQKRKCR